MRQTENERKKNKIIILIHSISTWNREFQKNRKKIQKIKKYQYGFFSSQNGMGEAENERKQILVRIHSNPTRNRECQKNRKKKSKNQKT